MRVILFGATGMVGQGVLRECLLASDVDAVLAVGRTPTGVTDPKLTDLVQRDLLDLSPIRDRLEGYDACLFCLGVSSVGMSEPDYRRITYDVTMAVAHTLAEVNPGSTFAYVSGAGTDSTAQGRTMWARVKGETENALLENPALEAYMFRPAFIQPMHGVRSKTRLYRAAYAVTKPLTPLFFRLFPRLVTTSERLGQAMLRVARSGAPKRVLASTDINELGAPAPNR